MKTPYKFLFISALLFLSVQIAQAQTNGYIKIPEGKRFVEIKGVEVDNAGKYDTTEFRKAHDIIYQTIKKEVDEKLHTLGDGTVYVLKRNHVYISGSVIRFEDVDIHIKGEEGEGRMPIVLHYKPNNANNGFIFSFQNVILENFEFDGTNVEGDYINRGIDFNGTNARIIVKGCRFTCDRGGALAIGATSSGACPGLKLYVYDCIFGNGGHYMSGGGNGRALDIRSGADFPIDTVVFKNNTIYNMTDRAIRCYNSITNYMEIDHNTIINNQGRHGSIQGQNTKELIVTNNVFANPVVHGDRLYTTLQTGEQGQQLDNAHPDKHFAIVTHNGTVGLLNDGEIKRTVMRNNNIFFEQEFIDLFKKFPTVFSAGYTINGAFYPVRPASDAVFTYLDGDPTKVSFVERLPFDYNDFPAGNTGTVSSYKDLLLVAEEVGEYFAAGNTGDAPAILPQNWSLLYPYEWNAVYPTTSISYTAADGGYPLGDLNWFPQDKAKWLTNPTAKSAMKSAEIPAGIEIARAYPNPFLSEAAIDYTLLNDQFVEISIYNYIGQKVKTIKGGNMKQGTYQVTWDGKDNNGNTQPVGVYQFVIKGTTGQASTKLLKN